MSDFKLRLRKCKRNSPTIKEGDVFQTVHGEITVLTYANNTNVQIEFADENVKPNPQHVNVAWIRRNQIKPGENNG